MRNWERILLFQVSLFIGTPVLLFVCMAVPAMAGAGSGGGYLGQFMFVLLWFLGAWAWYAYAQCRHCRQEEFLFLVQTAAATRAPVEQIVRAYLKDGPWFNAPLRQLLKSLEQGMPLDRAIATVPDIAARETAMAAAVGQYSGKLRQAMKRLPEGRSTPIWLEITPRLMYPFLLLAFMAGNVAFLMIFIIPKFEKIFHDFKMRLPYLTEALIHVSRWCIKYPYLLFLVAVLALALFNAAMYSSQVRWHLPLVGLLYRMKARGEFLQILGIMLETGKPLHEILERMLESKLLPPAVQVRVHGLLADLTQGKPLAESLARHELVTAPAQGLIASAQKSGKLAWALQELGDTLMRRCARLSYRAVAVAFPLMIFACAVLVGLVALALFVPLLELLKGLSGG